MKKIAVVFSGGTIGSELKTSGAVGLQSTSKKVLIDSYKDGDVLFTQFNPINVLSENMTKENLYSLVKQIRAIENDFDGIILTHGTDTLCFTAQYLSIVFSHINIPLVIVSSAYPLQDDRQNGSTNFYYAVKFILKNDRGVFVSYKNYGEDCKIHLASKIISSRQLDGYVDSLFGKEYAHFVGDKIFYNNIEKDVISVTSYLFCKNVFFIKSHSLIDYSLIPLIKDSIILIEPYHSGTVYNYDNAFTDFVKKASDRGVKVALAPIDSNANVYDSVLDAYSNVMLFYDMPYERALVLLMLGYTNV